MALSVFETCEFSTLLYIYICLIKYHQKLAQSGLSRLNMKLFTTG